MSDREEHNAARDPSNLIVETWQFALVLKDVEAYEKASWKFKEAMEHYEIASRGGCVAEYSANSLSFTSSTDLDLMNQGHNQPPLSWAAERGYEAVIGLLMGRFDADVDFKTRPGGRQFYPQQQTDISRSLSDCCKEKQMSMQRQQERAAEQHFRQRQKEAITPWLSDCYERGRILMQ
jgi:hypothetical protein